MVQTIKNLDIEGLADLTVDNLKNLPKFCATTDADIRSAIVGSIYPEKWVLIAKFIEPLKNNEVTQLYFIPPRIPLDPCNDLNIRCMNKKKEEISLLKFPLSVVHL